MVLALTDNTLKQNFVSLKKPKDINSIVHLKKPVRQKQPFEKKCVESINEDTSILNNEPNKNDGDEMAKLLQEFKLDGGQ